MEWHGVVMVSDFFSQLWQHTGHTAHAASECLQSL